MATRYELRTFKDIVDAIMEACQIQSSDTVERNRIKRSVQLVYHDEVLPYKQWQWLRGTANLQKEPYFGTGTVSVTSGSCIATLTDAPQATRKGFWFSLEGSNVKYRILAHTAGSTTLTLEVPFGESTNATARFKIWTDAIPLPNDLEEVIEIKHSHHIKPITNIGLQEMRRLEATGTKSEGYPAYYTTTDYKDPEAYADIAGLPASATRTSSGLVKTIRFASTLGASETSALLRPGDQIEVIVSGADGYRYSSRATVTRLFTGSATNDSISYTGLVNWNEGATADTGIQVRKLEPESYDKYREIITYPGIFNARINLELDYIKQIVSLEADTDEPVVPLRDRIVLYYGALYHTWTRKRNPEEAGAARQLFQAKLDKMAGKTEDSPDKPQMVPSKLYMGAKRAGQRLRSRRTDGISFGGSGATTAPSGNPSKVAVFGSDGYLQSSSITTLELDQLDGIDSNVQDQIDALQLEIDDLTLDTPVAANRVVLSEVDGTYRESTITETQLLTLSGVSAGSLTLVDNTGSPTTWLSVAHASYKGLFISYNLQRGAGNSAAGTLMVSTDGTTASIAEAQTSQGTLGVTFTAAISGANLLVQYTTTSTGTNVTGTYRLEAI